MSDLLEPTAEPEEPGSGAPEAGRLDGHHYGGATPKDGSVESGHLRSIGMPTR